MPRKQAEALSDRINEHATVAQSRQISVAGEIFDERLDRDVITTPERHIVEFEAEAEWLRDLR